MKSMRNRLSLTQEPSVLSVSKETLRQMGGSWLLRKAVYMSSRSDDMMTKPPIARRSSLPT